MKRFAFNERAVLAFGHDALMLVTSWAMSLALLGSVSATGAGEAVSRLGGILAFALPIQAMLSTALGMYQGLWRYASLPDVQRIVVSVLCGTLASATVLWFTGRIPPPGFAEFFIQSLLLVCLMAGSRIAYRTWQERKLYGETSDQGIPVLVLGAGDAAVSLLKELSRSAEWRVMGLLDDDPNKRNRLLHGWRVLGAIDDLPRVARTLKVKHAIIAMPSASYAVRRRIVEVCNRARVLVLTVPKFSGISVSRTDPAKPAPPKIRRVSFEDLMKRDPIVLDDAGLHELMTDKVIMVTGAGGSIGSELCRQIAAYQPSMLVLFEQSEFALYRIEQSLRDAHENLPIASIIGDIKNARRVAQVMHQYAPSLVFHAAAYKHVPMMEEQNSWEAVQNNVWGTLVVAKAAIEHRVKKFVLVSTDKAVNPTNVMGATKRLSEMICQALQQASETRFEIVRFGNVLGSAGSVIPRFQEQIENGGPVTVTHPDMVRYFMSIPEAAQLVMQAGAMGLGGEVFVLDMGEPVKIVDLAADMIRLAEPSDEEIKIVYTGLRPGEKLFEELLAHDEQTRPTPHPKLRIAKAREVHPSLIDDIAAWAGSDRQPDDSDVRRELKRFVPEYVAQVRARLKAVPAGVERKSA
jgi:FlaA1/EpsC-like NDP-sugar epimerase